MQLKQALALAGKVALPLRGVPELDRTVALARGSVTAFGDGVGVTVDVPDLDLDGQELLAPLKPLAGLVKGKADVVSFGAVEGGFLPCRVGGLISRVPAFDTSVFPSDLETPAAPGLVVHRLDVAELSRALAWALPACSPDEWRPHLNALLLGPDRIVVTDGHRLHVVEWRSGLPDFLLPRRAGEALLAALKAQKSGTVAIEATETVFAAVGEGWEVRSRPAGQWAAPPEPKGARKRGILDPVPGWVRAPWRRDLFEAAGEPTGWDTARFPPWERVRPEPDFATLRVKVDGPLLWGALKGLLASSKDDATKVSLIEGGLCFEAGEAQARIPATIEGAWDRADKAAPFGVNGAYLAEAVEGARGTVEIALRDPTSAFRVERRDGLGYAVIMPMRI